VRFLRLTAPPLLVLGLWVAASGATTGPGAPCPTGLAALEIHLTAAPGAAPSRLLVSGNLVEASCDAGERGAAAYSTIVDCAPSVPESCRTNVEGLRPGLWSHTVLGTGGESSGQFQAVRTLLLDRSAGIETLSWPLFRSVSTVSTLDDRLDCRGCLREALERANEALKPHLIQFLGSLAGTITLADRLPELSAAQITVDARNLSGLPLTRTIDADGLGRAALRITGSDNRIIGLRIVGVGGDSDALVIEGAGANGNVLESLQVVGRALASCDAGGRGCIVDGICRVQAQSPNGVCGDDAIAVRGDAGGAEANVVVDCDVSGAFDKGIKSSEGGVVVVRDSLIHDNADGGMQATLGGALEAYENTSENNRGTASANGIAANGPRLDGSDPAQLTTRGNVVRGNSLRGISVRSASHAVLRDDFTCGNGDQSDGFGLALLNVDASGPTVEIRGMAVIQNPGGGVLVADHAQADFGTSLFPGNNVFAFNGPPRPITPVNLRDLGGAQALSAVGNYWENCGRSTHCAEERVTAFDIFAPNATVAISPAAASVQRGLPIISSISPQTAAAGALVRIYGSGFDAISGNDVAGDCAAIPTANTCPPRRGNCVFVAGQAAEVVAVTPTMLVVRAPFTCVEPVQVAVRTRWARGFARAPFCVSEANSAASRN